MPPSSQTLAVVIGIDIGGTNTDVAIIHKQDGLPRVLADVKERTSSDVTMGVKKAVLKCLLKAKQDGNLVSPIQVNIGTTHFINAVVQGKHLTKVAVVRVCGPVSEELPPFCDFPQRLANAIRGSVHLAHGGNRFDGKHHEPVDQLQVRQIVREIRENNIKNIVIIGIFSPNRPNQELQVRDIVLDEFPEASITLSHEIGHIGLLERENAAILNESIKPMCKTTVEGFASAFEEIGVNCPFFFTQNDGTIISSKAVMEYPVFTFASGPTNSMRGAAFLTDERDAIVVDIGGTTSDVGVLKGGFPREASTNVRVAGVRTNFRMPDVVSIGLGGGSYVRESLSHEGALTSVKVGPLSAGLNLKREAYVFAEDGSTKEKSLTATDIAVAAGLCSLGRRENVEGLDRSFVETAVGEIHRMIDALVEQIKVSSEHLPVIIVGGGSVIIDRNYSFNGTTKLIIPNHFDVANAIGAGLSKISATLDVVFDLMELIDKGQMDKAVADARKEISIEAKPEETDFLVNEASKPFLEAAREKAINSVLDKAKARVVANGGKADSLEILEKSDSVLSYVPGNAIQIKVKAVGDFGQESITSSEASWAEPERKEDILSSPSSFDERQTVSATGQRIDNSEECESEMDSSLHPKEPTIDINTREWILNGWDIECISLGAGIYGCGGGGSTHIGRLRALRCIRDGKRIAVITPEVLLESEEKQIVIASGFVGAPLIIYEQGISSSETTKALQCLRDVYEIGNFKDGELQNGDSVKVDTQETGVRHIVNYQPTNEERTSQAKIVGLMSCEIGGLNAMEPLLIAANMGLPVVDVDGMSRAFPEVQMFAPFMYGKKPYPCAIVGSGNNKERSAALYCPHNKALETYIREVSIQNGCCAGLAFALDRDEVVTKTPHHTVSSAWRLGDAILRARLAKESAVVAIIKQERAKHIITGKVTDVKRETSGGFNRGYLTVEGIERWIGQEVLVEFQNENLVIFDTQKGNRKACLGTVPDLISVVDPDSGEPIQTEVVKYGLRVAVLLMPSHRLLRQPDALKWVGPQAFHYSQEFKPYENRCVTKPIPPVK